MDRDFDGRLTVEEFLGEETPIEKLFKLMDKNGDGYVSRKVIETIQRCKTNTLFVILGVSDNLHQVEQGSGNVFIS